MEANIIDSLNHFQMSHVVDSNVAHNTSQI